MSRYTDGKTVRILVETLKRGQTRQVACRAAGIHDSTFNAWMRDAKNKPEFSEKILAAEALSEEALVEIIQEHAKSDWRSAKWLLARRFLHWREQAYTRQEVRDQLDALRIRKAELEVQFVEMKMDAAKNAGGDQDLLAILNAPALEDKRDGKDEEEDKEERKAQRSGSGRGRKSTTQVH